MLRPLAIALSFLTRAPIALGRVEPRELGRAVAWFPIAGAALGLVILAGHRLLAGHVAPAIAATGLVTLLAAFTGGLHLDGVADTFDALGGGRGQRDRMLAILRDSRIGAHGATALILHLALKIFAVLQLLDAPYALFAAPIVARWAVVPLVVCFPYARPDGLGKAFHDHAGAAQLVTATGLAGLAPAAPICLGVPVDVIGLGAAAAAAAAAAIVLAMRLHRHLGGLTGDIYGAAIEVAELAFLTIAGLR